ncbi:type I secretion system permease/ATPase [Neorhizobium sp. T786]|uniref:type I secretion system permease/ATPase n=1 Tax=Pseudorhizobium xiangyangii TaxID=2883104 RepID=UPI001CFFB567|nr:type I secretion system permease/ATPase [Neorhizobium xiangyangii]MCB5205377.1 type I secretion system permease/ATPase [Neorhizobium xiangyangii]
MNHSLNSWAVAIEVVARYHGRAASADMIRQSFLWAADKPLEELLTYVTRRVGLTGELISRSIFDIPSYVLPIIAELKDGNVAIVTTVGDETISLLRVDSSASMERVMTREEAGELFSARLFMLSPAASVRDSQLGRYLAAYSPSWFWSLLFADKRRHLEIGVASFLANLLALASSLFSMQVWDRVVPSQSLSTLWVLVSGVFVAVMFEFMLRVSRVTIADTLGKKVDRTISSMVFGRALDICNDARPKSTGAFIAQLRETETIRESLASTTITAAIDIPFAITFLFVIWAVSGPLIWAVALALPLIIVPGLLIQIPLSKMSNLASREGALRHAILVESIAGIEDIKALQSEGRFHRLWDQYSVASSDVALKQKQYISTYIFWISSVQQICYVTVIILGVYMVLAGDLTTGAVIGASILTSRALAPFAQFAQIFTKWQATKTARKGLDELLQKPIDHQAGAGQLRRTFINGEYELSSVDFAYDLEQGPNLRISSLQIRPGEKIAIIGRNGAGKSTLLRLLANAIPPTNGTISIDGTNMRHIDVGDVRRHVALLTQDSRLFFGSLLENIKLGAPLATDEAVKHVLHLSGADLIVKSLPKGLETTILEGGAGLSGGQKQSVMLARTFLRDSSVVLLDEPTASLDEASERQLLARMVPWLAGRTFIISTHRPTMLELVDRIIVMDQGRIILDGAKELVLQRLSGAAEGDGR